MFSLQHATQVLAITVPPVRILVAPTRVLVTQGTLEMATTVQVGDNVYGVHYK